VSGDKCEFYKDEIKFFGIVVSKDGIAPTEDRCQALRDEKEPRNAKEVRSLLGSIQFSGRWIRDISDIAQPLWRLTQTGVEWQWTDVEQRAFERLKEALSTKCLAYYNKLWDTELIVDASPTGLGSVLVQINPNDRKQRHVIRFSSRLLTDAERKLSQCEKEGLAVVWACEHNWLYLLAKPFVIVTDNRAIQLIFGSGTARPPARIERLGLRLTPFDYTIQHRPGRSNVADYYSRHPSPTPPVEVDIITECEEYVCNAIEESLPDAVTRLEVAEATRADKTLAMLAQHVRNGPLDVRPAR
jgi:hypothetical protein